MQNCLTYMLLSVIITLCDVAETGVLSVAVGPIPASLQISLRRFVQFNGFIVLNLVDKFTQLLELAPSSRL